MATRRPRLLLCGFTAFPGAPRNPAGEIVGAMGREGWAPAGVDLETLLLPVIWREAFAPIEARLAKGGVDGVLLVGVAATSQACRVERLARNLASGSTPDAAGLLWGAVAIVDAGQASLTVTAPVEAMFAAITGKDIPCEISNDAGDYLCNFTLYRLLERAPEIPAGFLHIPQATELAEGGALFFEDQEHAVKAAAQGFASALAAKPVGLQA